MCVCVWVCVGVCVCVNGYVCNVCVYMDLAHIFSSFQILRDTYVLYNSFLMHWKLVCHHGEWPEFVRVHFNCMRQTLMLHPGKFYNMR